MKKIVIVEDDHIISEIYRNRLSIEGYEVNVAPDGCEGLQLIQKVRPDLAIVDLMLPNMSGVELIQALRANPLSAKLPVLVFSNAYLASVVENAMKAGANQCLSKVNSTPRNVMDAVRKLLNGPGEAGATPVVEPPRKTPSHPHTAAVPQPTAAETDKSATTDAGFQAGLRASLIDSLPVTLTALRAVVHKTVRAVDEPAKLKQLQELNRRIHALTGNAGVAGLSVIAQMCEAIEALLRELLDKPRNLNASTLRTMAAGIDFLGTLFTQAAEPDRPRSSQPQILVVDDEPISRRAVAYALEKAKLKSTSIEDSEAAYNLILHKKFDLIFLDVHMPGMNGYELCAKLRGLPAHKNTPVVFVTGLNDLENRAQSMVSGGNDFIGKPFLFTELAVKALIYVLRSQVKPAA